MKNYTPKVILGRLKTGGKSISQIREQYKNQKLSDSDLESIRKMYEAFDGLSVQLSLWEFDTHESYHLHGWDDKDDWSIMNGLYFAEQIYPFSCYKDDFERFSSDWKTNQYYPDASLTFFPEDVEEIETICEESNL